MNIFIKFLLSSILTILITISCTEKQDNQKVEEYIKKSEDYYKKYDDIKSLEHAKKAYDLSLESGSKRQIAESCYWISLASKSFGLENEAIEYAKKGKKHCPKDEELLHLKLEGEEIRSLLGLELYDQALPKYRSLEKKVSSYPNIQSNTKALIFLNEIYQMIATIYSYKEDGGNLLLYTEKADRVLISIPEKEKIEALPYHYFHKGQQFLLDPAKIDSAFALYTKSLELKKKYNNSILHMEYLSFGDYYYYKNDHIQSLEYYQKALDNMEVHNNIAAQMEFIDIYKDVAEIYEILGNKEKQNEYLKKYIVKKNDLEAKKKKNIDYAVNVVLKEEKKKTDTTKKTGILAFSIVSLLLLGMFIYFLKVRKKKKNIVIALDEKEEMIEELNKKVNESFEEITQLAKTNSPEFFSRFQEVYPEFRNKLLQINPDLKITELILCAYIHLGFNTKDIAEYTFKAEKTIRNNKYNVRKRLDVPTKSDFTIWLRNQIEE